jgi:hypothetical protein
MRPVQRVSGRPWSCPHWRKGGKGKIERYQSYTAALSLWRRCGAGATIGAGPGWLNASRCGLAAIDGDDLAGDERGLSRNSVRGEATPGSRLDDRRWGMAVHLDESGSSSMLGPLSNPAGLCSAAATKSAAILRGKKTAGQRRRPEVLRTAMATAFFCPTSTTPWRTVAHASVR